MLAGIEKKYRDEFSRGMDVLQVVSEIVSDRELSKTNVLYRANLTWKDLGELIAKLLRAGWIVEIYQGKRSTVKITPDGSEVLKTYKMIRNKFEGE